MTPDFLTAAVGLVAFLFSVIVHEVAHGWVALREGDPTAYMLGRLTLNPIPHIDPIGSILVPLVLYMSHAGFLFGWARPVPVNTRNFRKYKRGDILVSLAGIAANLLLAVGFLLLALLCVLVARTIPGAMSVVPVVQAMAMIGIELNLLLAFFNIIPIPPLDGSHVFYYLLPPRLGAAYRDLGRFGMLLLLLILFVFPGVTRVFLWPAMFLQSQALALIPPLS